MPGMIVRPETSMRVAPDGTDTESEGPTAVMRFSSTTTVPFSITRSPSIATMRAPTSAMLPDGWSLAVMKPIAVRAASPSSSRVGSSESV